MPSTPVPPCPLTADTCVCRAVPCPTAVPPHTVIVMPSLSPTMTQVRPGHGTLPLPAPAGHRPVRRGSGKPVRGSVRPGGHSAGTRLSGRSPSWHLDHTVAPHA